MPLLLCQKDSYAQSVVTAVKSCTPGPDGYAVVLEETVLFPESGGQPSDWGTVAGFPVKAVAKRPDGEVTHLLDQAVVGRVEVAVDWARRYDHMQQHTAQHVLSAVGEDRYNLNTTAFHLGAERSDIELDSANIAPGTLQTIEDEVNTVIRADLPVTASEVDPAELGRLAVRTRGLPESCTGLVRVVEIVGVDRNNCGGTHVRRTAEIQVFKITGTEPMRGGTRVHFLAGGRAVRAFDEALKRERALTAALSCGSGDHEAAVRRLLEDVKAGAKAGKTLRQELAAHLGAALASDGGSGTLHRPEADADFVRAIAAAAGGGLSCHRRRGKRRRGLRRRGPRGGGQRAGAQGCRNARRPRRRLKGRLSGEGVQTRKPRRGGDDRQKGLMEEASAKTGRTRVLFCQVCGAPLDAPWHELTVVCRWCEAKNLPGTGIIPSSSMAFDERPRLNIGGRTYVLEGLLAQGDSTDVYRARWSMRLGELVVIKVLRSPADADLLRSERETLDVLRAAPGGTGEYLFANLPEPIAIGPVKDETGRERLASVFRWRSGYVHTLEEVGRTHRDGVPGPVVVWLWKRLLELLAFVHDAGFVHGAVIPPHVLVHPRDHGAALIGWGTATRITAGGAPERVPALSRAWLVFYPQETRSGRNATPSMDVVMSARCALAAAGGDMDWKAPSVLPAELGALLAETAGDSWSGSARSVLDSLKDVSTRVFGPPAYHPLPMPGWRQVSR